MIAIVPARSGSKGLPGKNIKILNGKPMISYTIEEALKSKYISEVIISTDCKEIEAIALKNGAKSYFLRPEYLATDKAKAIDNYIYTIDRLNNDFNFNINDFIVLQPTSPLRKDIDIDTAIEMFNSKKSDSVISYTEADHPIEWHKYISKDGGLENIFSETILNRQTFKKTYYPNGAIYVFSYKLIKLNSYYNENSYAYIMPKFRSIDIDTLEDFQYAELLLGRVNDWKS
jgi:CMP-N,N'-diacetyllegionaminic acid synthase